MTPDRRAELLLRWYPRLWRERYGEELAWLLADDIRERPRSLERVLDVARAGFSARLTALGIGSGPVVDRRRIGATAVVAAAIFSAAAASTWTQLARGALGGAPDSAVVRLGLVTLSVGGVVLVLAAAAGAGRLARTVGHSARTTRHATLLRPAATVIGSFAFLVAGAWQLSMRAPGLPHVSAAARVVRLGWAATDSISAYWLHPTRLLALSATELAWMFASPVAAVLLVRGLLRLGHSRETEAGPASSTWMPRLAGWVLLPMFVTSATWVVASQHAPDPALRTGTLDLGLVAAMALSALAIQACRLTSQRHR